MYESDGAYWQRQAQDARTELESLRKDAERYRWLRDEGCSTWVSFQFQWKMTRAQCDAAIDAAMKDKP